MEAAIEAPPSQAPASAPSPSQESSPGISLSAAIAASKDSIGKTMSQVQSQPPEKAAVDKAPPAEKIDATPPKPRPKVKTDPKNPMAALDEVKIEEPPVEQVKEEEAAPVGEEEQPPPDSEKGAGKRWKELKTKEKELETIKPELESLRQKIQEMEASKLDDTVKQELEELRSWKTALDFQNTPEFQQNITKPIESAAETLQSIADHIGIDPAKINDIVFRERKDKESPVAFAVIQEQDMRALIDSSEKEFSREAFGNAAMKAVELIRSKLEEGGALASKAHEIREAMEAEKTTKSLAERQKEAQEWSTAAESVYSKVSNHPILKDMMADKEIADAVKNAALGDTPELKAFAAQSAMLLPNVTKRLADSISQNKALQATIAKLEKSLADRAAARPGAMGAPSQPAQTKPSLSLQDAMRSSGFRV